MALKILAIKLRALGDTVLMTAPLLELRRAYPEAEIHALVLSRWAPLLESHPAVNRIWTFDRPANRTKRATLVAQTALQLRREGFDVVVNLHASPSSATLAFSSGAKSRAVHFHGHHDKNRFSTVPIPGKGTMKPIIERDMDALRALGIHVPAGRLPKIFLQTSEIEQARERLRKLGMLPSLPVLGLGLGASRPSKMWPMDRFSSLAIEWCQRQGGSVLAVVGEDEEHLEHSFLKSLDDWLSQLDIPSDEKARIRTRVVVQRGLPLRQLAAMLNQVKVFAGNDSGPRHLAVATGTRTVTIFGPEHPFEWHPYPPQDHPILFQEQLACRADAEPGMPPWCGVEVCIKEEHRCMKTIGVNAVYDQLLKI